ncbi:MAG: NAD(P)-dependent oxidoreductase [Planctomycetaceae bacterium]|nr:NAD(P)-dependent oxidoreductase [Planctomycetaceae bacterium]
MADRKRILLTGDRGYVGSVLGPLLEERGYEVIGFDAGYYADRVLLPTPGVARQITGDIRDFDPALLDGVYGIVHLAGLSNDPIGELNPNLTDEINRDATIRLAQLARARGVARFVYASSQSMYGIANTDAELDEDNSEKNPQTSYARTKWEAELAIKELCDDRYTVVCMRPSTVFGASPRLRCDIVYNNLVACAFTTGKIEIKSDGTPWRPVVHVRDVCSAFIAGLEAPTTLVNGRSYNVGIPDGNFTVRQLAEAAQRAVPGSSLIFTGEHGSDSRTYRVSFQRILSELKDWFRPEWDLDRGGRELVEFFRQVGLTEAQFRGRDCVRLMQLKHAIGQGQLNNQLRSAS